MPITSNIVKVKDVIENNAYCPFPVHVLPSYMGINLDSVDSISWQQLEDGQLVNLTINFFPTCSSKFKNTK